MDEKAEEDSWQRQNRAFVCVLGVNASQVHCGKMGEEKWP